MGQRELDGLNPLLKPQSIAIVGVSESQNRATMAFHNLEQQGYSGDIYLVNPKYDKLYERRCYSSLKELPQIVDCVFLSIPAHIVFSTLQEAVSLGIPAAVIISSGFGEGEGFGKVEAQKLRELSQKSGLKICGPNCLGIITPSNRSSSYGYTLPEGLLSGRVSGIFQSGSVLETVVTELSQRGIGFNIAISSGNEIAVSNSEYLEYLAQDAETDIIVGYIENFQNIEQFRHAAELAREKRKPIILLKVGRSPQGAKAALAHTASYVGDDDVVEAVFQELGIVRCYDLAELIETTILFSLSNVPRNSGVACITFSGGDAGIYQDLNFAEKIGLYFPALSASSDVELRKLLPPFASVSNPLDATGAVALNEDLFCKVLNVFLVDPQINVIAVSGNPSGNTPATRTIITALKKIKPNTEKSVLFFSPTFGCYDGTFGTELAKNGIPVLRGARSAFAAIENLSSFGGAQVLLRTDAGVG